MLFSTADLRGREMHILLAIVGAIGAIGVLLWRMQMAANATRDIVETAQDAGRFFRSWRWRKKANANPLDLIEDPREAAAAMMVAAAQYDGSLSAREEAAIMAEMRYHFEADEKTARDLLARGRWLAKDASDLGQTFHRASAAVRKRCTPKELNDLVTMLREVAKADGAPSDVVKVEIDRLADSINRS